MTDTHVLEEQPSLIPHGRPLRVLLGLVGGTWAGLAIAFGRFDLNISQAVVAQHSGFAEFIEHFGESPGILVMIGAVVIAYSQRQRCENRLKEAVLTILTLVSSAFVLYLLIGWVLFIYYPAFVAAHSFAVLIVVTLGLTLQRVFLKPLQVPIAWRRASFVSIWLGILNMVLFTQGFKAFWGRVRFRDLQPDYVDFTAWYERGTGSGQSFPSGHTASAWMILPVILLAIPHGRKATIVVSTLALSWGIIVAAGRVVAGAH